MTNHDKLELLKAHVKKLGYQVPNPNFMISGAYSPQWKCSGSIDYYELPRGGRILAFKSLADDIVILAKEVTMK